MHPHRAPLLAGSLLALALCPKPAHAELVFRGPHHENEALIRALYAALPARGKNVDVIIQEVPADEWSRLEAADDPAAVGVYDDETREMFLKLGEPDMAWTFVHEFGHHVFFAAMSNSERKDWRRYWKKHQAEMPEGDAQDEPDEGFAECFAGAFCKEKLPWTLTAALSEKTRSYFTTASQPDDHTGTQTAMLPDRPKRRRRE